MTVLFLIPALILLGVTINLKKVEQKEEEMTTATPTYSTAREQRESILLERLQTGCCRYCDAKAVKQVPGLKLITSWLDSIYRYLNVVPIARWKIEIERDISIPNSLCEKHHEIARGHLERKIAENQVDYAVFVEKLRSDMYEFERFSLDERMREEVETIKRGKSKKTIASNNVLSLKAKNG